MDSKKIITTTKREGLINPSSFILKLHQDRFGRSMQLYRKDILIESYAERNFTEMKNFIKYFKIYNKLNDSKKNRKVSN